MREHTVAEATNMTYSYGASHVDEVALAMLGLRTTGFTRDWTTLGTVVIHDRTPVATTVKVEVAALPAQFWRFTVRRPADKDGPVEAESLVITTGSGRFTDYWPSVCLVADNCLHIDGPDQ